MKTEKLTLRLEGELIDLAKRTAEERGTSVSKMVAGFFESIEDPQATEEDNELSDLGEVARRLRGSISPIKSIKRTDGRNGQNEQNEQDEQDRQSADEQDYQHDYRRYLERKHG